jgi:hypothetical protein
MTEKASVSYGSQGCREAILIRDGWQCYYCRKPFSINMDGWNNMTIDHKNPQSKSEDQSVHELDNLVISCRNCNSAKNDMQFTNADINSFKELRCAIRKRDEHWVQDRYSYIIEMITKPSENEKVRPWDTEYIEEIAMAFKMKLQYFDNVTVRKVSRPYIDFFNNGKEWTFEPDSFALQPFFIYKLESKIKDNIIGSILDKCGYIGGSDYRSKYLKPFRTISEGIEAIVNEIRWVNDFWLLWQGEGKFVSTER